MTMQRIISPWPEDGFSRASRRMALLYHPRREVGKDKKEEREGTKSVLMDWRCIRCGYGDVVYRGRTLQAEIAFFLASKWYHELFQNRGRYFVIFSQVYLFLDILNSFFTYIRYIFND